MRNLKLFFFFVYGVANVLYRNTGAVTAHKLSDTFRSFEGMILNSQPDYTLSAASAIDCTWHCLQANSCNSVNYERTSGTCEINIGRKLNFAGDTLEHRTGWSVYEKEPCGLGYQTGVHCHHVIAATKTWDEAVQFCGELGETLPEYFSYSEKDALVEDVLATGETSYVHIWLGLKESTMLWNSGASISFLYWYPTAQMDTIYGCIGIVVNWLSDKWYDYPCSDYLYSVCERRYN